MRVQTEEWRRFIPGVRMYKGKKTLFYNGEILWEGDFWNGRSVRYDWQERDSWEVIIVLPGVRVIPYGNFSNCENVKVVIMSDTVRRVKHHAFRNCKSLSYVKLSRNLEYIGEETFYRCESLPSIFIPPSCGEIRDRAFCYCAKLIILSVPHQTYLGANVIGDTALIRRSMFETNDKGFYDNTNEVNNWIKNIHGDTDEYALHRACSSYYPITEIIYGIVKRQGLKTLKKKNEIGITPLEYLEANPFAYISQSALMKRYILDMMGEITANRYPQSLVHNNLSV